VNNLADVLMVFDTERRAAAMRMYLKDNVRAVGVGTALAGSGFDRIVIVDDLDCHSPSVVEREMARRWYDELLLKLKPDAKLEFP
jgi:hypothetical protein